MGDPENYKPPIVEPKKESKLDELLKTKEKEKETAQQEPAKPVEEKKKWQEKQKEAAEALNKATAVLAEYGNKVSDVPVNSPYWDHMRAYGVLEEEWKRLRESNL